MIELFYLMFVSSSAPTLRSALHFCRRLIYMSKCFKEKKHTRSSITGLVNNFWQVLYLEVCCIYRASIADWACHGEVTACIPESRSVALKSMFKEATNTLQPPTRLLCAHQVSVGLPGKPVLLQQTAWESQTGEMRISLAESWISLLEILFFFTWR